FRTDAHVVHDGHADHRRRAVRGEDHPQPVREREPFNRVRRRGNGYRTVACADALGHACDLNPTPPQTVDQAVVSEACATSTRCGWATRRPTPGRTTTCADGVPSFAPRSPWCGPDS